MIHEKSIVISILLCLVLTHVSSQITPQDMGFSLYSVARGDSLIKELHSDHNQDPWKKKQIKSEIVKNGFSSILNKEEVCIFVFDTIDFERADIYKNSFSRLKTLNIYFLTNNFSDFYRLLAYQPFEDLTALKIYYFWHDSAHAVVGNPVLYQKDGKIYLPKLESFSLQTYASSSFYWNTIYHFLGKHPSVKSLILDGSFLSFQGIEHASQIESISFQNSFIRDIPDFTSLTKLKKVIANAVNIPFDFRGSGEFDVIAQHLRKKISKKWGMLNIETRYIQSELADTVFKALCKVTSLEHLEYDLFYNSFTLAQEVTQLVNLKTLILDTRDLQHTMVLPANIGELKNLEVLDIQAAAIGFPASFFQLKSLTSLDIRIGKGGIGPRDTLSYIPHQRIDSIYRHISLFPNLKHLKIDCPNYHMHIGQHPILETLIINGLYHHKNDYSYHSPKLKKLPLIFFDGPLSSLRKLNITKAIVKKGGNRLPNVESVFYYPRTILKEVPYFIVEMAKLEPPQLKSITLRGYSDTKFRKWKRLLEFPNRLDTLVLDYCGLRKIPLNYLSGKKIDVLVISNNEIRTISQSLCNGTIAKKVFLKEKWLNNTQVNVIKNNCKQVIHFLN